MRNKKRLVCLLLAAVCAISCLLAMGQVFADETVLEMLSQEDITEQAFKNGVNALYATPDMIARFGIYVPFP